jgi:hypothetical protein
MSKDIVDRLTAWVEHEAREPDPASAILDARDAIIATRKALMNLSAAVVGSDTLEEARSIAWKLAPLDDRSVLMQGFHEVESLWRFDPKTVEGFKAVVLPASNEPASEPPHPSALHAMTFSQPWISADERLPEDGERVIAYFPEETESVGEATFRLTEENQWLSEHGSWFLVTHWMPLPAPPEVAK